MVNLKGSHYKDPILSWRRPVALTDAEFFNSSKFGERYANNLFVGDFNNGNLYFFSLEENRTDIKLDENNSYATTNLSDRVIDNEKELSSVPFGANFRGGITDIKTGPDGFLYILTLSGQIYRITPATSSENNNDNTLTAGIFGQNASQVPNPVIDYQNE